MKNFHKVLAVMLAAGLWPVSGNAATVWFVVDTMQTNCYNTTGVISAPAAGQGFYGQDAQFFGNQSGYTLGGSGKTVYDNNTGLTWMRSPNTNNTPPAKPDRMTFAAIPAWVASVNSINYGGHNDWRLPTIKELYSLFDCRGTDPGGYQGSDTSVLTPFIDTNYFKFAWGNTALGERLIDQQYASSTTFILNPSESGYQKDFGVNFSDGRIKGYDLTDTLSHTLKTFYVQLVCGGTNYGVNNFTNNGDGTVTDMATGLMWSQGDNGSGVLWSNALAWVQTKNAANFLGHNDWRMPDVKELQSIVNYSNAPDYNGLPAIDTKSFTCTVITNEAGQADFPYYWTASTHGSYSTNNAGGGEADYVPFGRALGWPSTQTKWIDVHGAGCQRSDPKVGPPYPYAATKTTITNGVTYTGYSFGPQGDAIRGLNFVRLVRSGNYSSVDHVGDGIPDGWRRQYFGGTGTTTNATSCAVGNPDGDGFNNWQEYIADMNPTNALSYFMLQSVTNDAGFKVVFQSSANRRYTLYSKVNLVSGEWTNIPSQTDIPGSGGVDVLADSASLDPQRFYRVGVTLR